MATVPGIQSIDNRTGAPVVQPSPTQIMMAAAEMHRMGKFDQAGPEDMTQRVEGMGMADKREGQDPSSPFYKGGKDSTIKTPAGPRLIKGSEGERAIRPGTKLPDERQRSSPVRDVRGT